MMLSRREFLACTAGLVTASRPRARLRPESESHGLVVVVPGECSLPESAQGFAAALAGVRSPLLVIPAVVELPRTVGTLIARQLRDAGTVLVESGAGFAGKTDFRRHRASLDTILEIDTRPPLDLWDQPRRAPYVEWTWPRPATLRDFSRVVPVRAQPGEIIAWAEGVPVALRRRVGDGTLIFVGSPLGPALWAGDAQARSWLALVSNHEQMRAHAEH